MPLVRHGQRTAQRGNHNALGQMRALGIRSVCVTCGACGHVNTVNVDDWQDDMLINAFRPYAKCAECQHIGGEVRPDWRERRTAGGRGRR
jgi:hypothetical protein